jgi:hypothetical protein
LLSPCGTCQILRLIIRDVKKLDQVSGESKPDLEKPFLQLCESSDSGRAFCEFRYELGDGDPEVGHWFPNFAKLQICKSTSRRPKGIGVQSRRILISNPSNVGYITAKCHTTSVGQSLKEKSEI